MLTKLFCFFTFTLTKTLTNYKNKFLKTKTTYCKTAGCLFNIVTAEGFEPPTLRAEI